ncbi:WD repeat-containing protein 5B [Linum perenne]
MDRKRTMTMNWDAFGDHDDDQFFDCNRLSTAVPSDRPSSDSDEDDDDFEESRPSFSATLSSNEFRNYSFAAAAMAMSPQYDIWMAAPGSITERRNRLLQGMGLAEEKAIAKMVSREFSRAITRKIAQVSAVAAAKAAAATSATSASSASKDERPPENAPPAKSEKSDTPKEAVVESKHEKTASSSQLPVMLVRSRSDSDIESFANDRLRKEEVFGLVSKQRITRTISLIMVSHARVYNYSYPESVRMANREEGDGKSSTASGGGHKQGTKSIVPSINGIGAFFLIKNLDTGKEFVVNEYDQNGSWNRVSDLQTGKKLTMEEFEKSVGHSPVVKELMRREDIADERKLGANNYFSKSLRMSKNRGAALVKSIKGVAHSMSMSASKTERDRDLLPPIPNQKGGGGTKNSAPSGWIKVRLTGKSHKELSALHLCQEIQAHEGSIWTLKFSSDARYLASGGEDKVIHIWEVQECEVLSLHDGNLTPLHPSLSNSVAPSLGDASQMPSSKKKKKGSTSKKSNPIPEYVHFSPGNPSEVLVTSADSTVRIMDGKDLVHKFTGFKNVNSQIAASFTLSGKHVVCASEDSNIYVWKREEGRPGKGKSAITCRGLEAFPCKDVSVAIPFPGTVKGDPPPLIPTTKSKSKRQPSTEDHSPANEEATSASKKPPLPKNPKGNSKKDDKDASSTVKEGKEDDDNSKDDKAGKDGNNVEEKAAKEEDDTQISGSNSGTGESFSSEKSEESASTTTNPPSSLFEGSSQGQGGSSNNQASAWGLVIVAATSGGKDPGPTIFGWTTFNHLTGGVYSELKKSK